MDGYPPGSLDPSVPFLVASGLVDSPPNDHYGGSNTATEGTVLKSEVPSLTGENAQVLHDYLAGVDATLPPWSLGDKKRPYRYRVESVGRVTGEAYLDTYVSDLVGC